MIANGSLSTKGLWCTSNLHWLRCKGGKRIGVFIGGYEQKNQHNVITDSTYAALVTFPPPPPPRIIPLFPSNPSKTLDTQMKLQILI